MKGRNPTCKNHPGRKILGSCHACRDWFCHECLLEGPEYYYCKKEKCHRAFQKETKFTIKPQTLNCPSCLKSAKRNPRFCPSCGYRLKPVAEDEMDDLVTIARYGTALEAHLARTKLESENIESYVADEHIISLFPTRDIGWGGVKLKTKKSEAELALRIFHNPKEGSVWVMHPIAAAVYGFPDFFGFLLLIVLTPFAFLLQLILKFGWKFIKLARKPQAFKPGDEWLPGGPTGFLSGRRP